MGTIMQQFIETIRNNPSRAYDFIGNHAHEMKKTELRSVILEMICAMDNWTAKKVYKEAMSQVADELEATYKAVDEFEKIEA